MWVYGRCRMCVREREERGKERRQVSGGGGLFFAANNSAGPAVRRLDVCQRSQVSEQEDGLACAKSRRDITKYLVWRKAEQAGWPAGASWDSEEDKSQ